MLRSTECVSRIDVESCQSIVSVLVSMGGSSRVPFLALLNFFPPSYSNLVVVAEGKLGRR